MALYREDASGFLQEHASSPGAGYTAISSMPTDTIANRVAWWRALDTYGQTSTWHPSEYRSPEDPAEAALTIRFSREAGFISADPDGTVTDAYLAANTEVRVYRGFTDVTITEGWTLSKVEDGCTSTLTESGGVYTLQITDIPLLATKQGYVRITAERIGVEVVRDFNFIKVPQGVDGYAGNWVSYVFVESATAPATPTGTATIPSGWADAPPSGAVNPVWMSKATVVGATGLAGTWSTPVQVTGGVGAPAAGGLVTTYEYNKGTSSAATASWQATPYTLGAGEFGWMREKRTWQQVGNPNLARKLSAWSLSGGATLITGSTEALDGEVLEYTDPGAGSYRLGSSSATLPAGDYTLSFDAWTLSGTNTLICDMQPDGGADSAPATLRQSQPVITTTRTRYQIVFRSGHMASTGVRLFVHDANPGTGTVRVANVKFEAGAAQTGWCRHASDIDGGTGTAYRVTGEKGEQGSTGPTGPTGTRGSRQILVTTATGAWDDLTAWNGIVAQTGTTPVPSDLVTIAKTDGTVANSKFYVSGASPGTWSTPTAYINGNLLVTGTVGANQITAGSITATQISATAGITAAQINSNGLSIKDGAGNVILQAGSPIDSGYVSSDNQNLVPGLPAWVYGSGVSRITGETAAQSGDSIYIPASNTNTADSPATTLFADYVAVSFKGIYYSGTARSAYIRIYTADYATLIASTTIPLTNSVARYMWTTSAVVSTASYRLVVSATSGTAVVQIFDIKVERSAKATAWIPYGQDVTSVYNPITSGNVGTFIADAAITNAKIANATITSAKIANATIVDANIAAATITAASIANATITGAKIASATITDANIGSLSATKITTGTLNAASVTVTNLNATNISTGSLDFQRLSVGGVPCDRLASGAVSQIFAASTGTGYGSAAINTTIAAWSQSFSAVGANEVRGKIVAEFSVAAYVATTYYVYITLAIFKNGVQVATYQSTPGEFASISGLYVDTAPGATPSYVFYVTYNTNYTTVSRIANGMLMEIRK